MKRIVRLLLLMLTSLLLAACGGGCRPIDLKEPVAIPESGVIEKRVWDEIKKEKAIATFTGVSGEWKYEWTVFGSDLDETRDINLSVRAVETDVGIKLAFAETQDLGFPALLSLSLNERWTANSATAYEGDRAVYSVSITGSRTSILNISVNTMVAACEIRPDIDEQAQTDTAGQAKADTAGQTQADTAGQAQAEASREPGKAGEEGGSEYRPDEYLSAVTEPDDRVYAGEEQKERGPFCTFSIECSTILNNLDRLNPDKRELIPSNGVILPPPSVAFREGDSVFDVLQRVCRDKGIHLESSWTPLYNSAYIEGIHNLYEFDCGQLSGWNYRVNGRYPNLGCSGYVLSDGDKVEWRYTCDLGRDIGCDWMGE